jgi:hypothetical protein
MSSYRPPYQRRNVWPDREAEKREAARKAEEEIRKKNEMNETNFPSLSTARPVKKASGTEFAQLAQNWAINDAVDRRMAEYKKFQEAADRTRIATRHAQRTRHERLDDEFDEEELAPEPRAAGSSSVFDDDAGWTEVKHKSYKPKRELTVEEMDERDRRQEEENTEFNAHLFESNRHDHDRV